LESSKIFPYVALAIVAAFMLIPIVWLISTSFKPESEIFTSHPTLIPLNPTTENYNLLFTKFRFGQALINSTIVLCYVQRLQ